MDFLRRSSGEENGRKIPTYPAATLAFHVATKGAQLGSCAGLGISVMASVVSVCLGRKRPELFRKIMVPFTLLGVGATSGLLYGKHYRNELDDLGVDDRAYRIVNNEGQNKVDKYSLGGLLAGALAGVIVGQNFFTLSFAGLALGPCFYKAEGMYIAYKKSKNVEIYDEKWTK